MALLNWGGTYSITEGKGYVSYKSNNSIVSSQYTGNGVESPYLYQLLFTDVDTTTKTGHIITHGIDYTPDYTANSRGFVPYCNANSPVKSLLFGDATWREIVTTDLPMVTAKLIDTADTYTEANLFSAASVIKLLQELRNETADKLADAIKSNDAMRFMGGVSQSALGGELIFEVHDPDKTLDSLQAGDTFRATSDITLPAGTKEGSSEVMVESGDLLIFCGSDDTELTTADNSDLWIVVEGNIKGTATHSVNGTGYKVAADDATGFTIYAPSTAGTKGSLLYSTGATPEWATPEWDTPDTSGSSAIAIINKEAAPEFTILTNKTVDFLNGKGAFVDQKTITAGKLYNNGASLSYDATDLLSDFTFTTTDSKVSSLAITIGDTSKQVDFTEQLFNLTAAKVKEALTTDDNTGIYFETAEGQTATYDGSVAKVLKLSTASKTQLGVVKVDVLGQNTDAQGENYKVGKGIGNYEGLPTLSIVSGDTNNPENNGLLYLTKDNVCAALGFEPGNLDQTFTYKLFVSAAQTTTTENATLSDADNPYINFTSTHQDNDSGTPVTKVDDFIQFVGTSAITVTGKTNTIEIDTPYAYTGIKVGANKSIDTTTLTAFNASANATVLEFLAGDGIKLEQDGSSVTINTNFVSSNSNHLTLDTATNGQITFNSIWRDVKINDTSVGEDTNLNFVSSSDILVATSVDDSADTTQEIGFCIAWHNIKEDKIEYVGPSSNKVTA